MVGARLMRSWQLGSQKKSVIDATSPPCTTAAVAHALLPVVVPVRSRRRAEAEESPPN